MTAPLVVVAGVAEAPPGDSQPPTPSIPLPVARDLADATAAAARAEATAQDAAIRESEKDTELAQLRARLTSLETENSSLKASQARAEGQAEGVVAGTILGAVAATAAEEPPADGTEVIEVPPASQTPSAAPRQGRGPMMTFLFGTERKSR